MKGIVTSQMPIGKGRCTCDTLPHIFDISVFKIVKKNSTTIKDINNWFANIIEGCNNAFNTNDC